MEKKIEKKNKYTWGERLMYATLFNLIVVLPIAALLILLLRWLR